MRPREEVQMLDKMTPDQVYNFVRGLAHIAIKAMQREHRNRAMLHGRAKARYTRRKIAKQSRKANR